MVAIYYTIFLTVLSTQSKSSSQWYRAHRIPSNEEIMNRREIPSAQLGCPPFIVAMLKQSPRSPHNNSTGHVVPKVQQGQVTMRTVQDNHTPLVIRVLKESNGYRTIRRESPCRRYLIPTPTPFWSWCIVVDTQQVGGPKEVSIVVKKPLASSFETDGFHPIVEEIIGELSILLWNQKAASLVIWFIEDMCNAVTAPNVQKKKAFTASSAKRCN